MKASQIGVGEVITSRMGHKYQVEYIEGDNAWLKSLATGSSNKFSSYMFERTFG